MTCIVGNAALPLDGFGEAGLLVACASTDGRCGGAAVAAAGGGCCGGVGICAEAAAQTDQTRTDVDASRRGRNDMLTPGVIADGPNNASMQSGQESSAAHPNESHLGQYSRPKISCSCPTRMLLPQI